MNETTYAWIVHSDINENNIYSEFATEEEAIDYARRHKDELTYVDKVEVVLDEDGDIEEIFNSETIWVYDDEDNNFFESLVEDLEENEDIVECKECFELFPKTECAKIEIGYVCPLCNKSRTNLDSTNDSFFVEFPDVERFNFRDENKTTLDEPVSEPCVGSDCEAPVEATQTKEEVVDILVKDEHDAITGYDNAEIAIANNAEIDPEEKEEIIDTIRHIKEEEVEHIEELEELVDEVEETKTDEPIEEPNEQNQEVYTESQSQEISKAYKSLSKKYGIDLEELVYGEDGFMKTKYPKGFSDFAGDVIYSEKYWTEFETWLKETKGIELTESLNNNSLTERKWNGYTVVNVYPTIEARIISNDFINLKAIADKANVANKLALCVGPVTGEASESWRVRTIRTNKVDKCLTIQFATNAPIQYYYYEENYSLRSSIYQDYSLALFQRDTKAFNENIIRTNLEKLFNSQASDRILIDFELYSVRDKETYFLQETLNDKKSLTESSLVKDNYEISSTEHLSWGWDKNDNFYVEKNYRASENEQIWNTEFRKTYATEEDAKRAFSYFVRKYKKLALKEATRPVKEELFDWELDNVGFAEDSLTTSGDLIRGDCTVYGHLEVLDGKSEETVDDARFKYNTKEDFVTVLGLTSDFSENEVSQIEDVLLDNLKTNL